MPSSLLSGPWGQGLGSLDAARGSVVFLSLWWVVVDEDRRVAHHVKRYDLYKSPKVDGRSHVVTIVGRAVEICLVFGAITVVQR